MLNYYFNRLQTINWLIRIKGTGTPQQLSKRLKISERTLYELLKVMKEMGAPIHYCRYRQTYYYSEDGEFCVRFLKLEAGG